MENNHRPRRLIIRILEYAGLFALSTFLLRLGIAYLREIWWILLLILGAAALSVVLHRLWQRNRWR